jgi:hypothetical protein
MRWNKARLAAVPCPQNYSSKGEIKMSKFSLGRLVATYEVSARMETDTAFFDFINASLSR